MFQVDYIRHKSFGSAFSKAEFTFFQNFSFNSLFTYLSNLIKRVPSDQKRYKSFFAYFFLKFSFNSLFTYLSSLMKQVPSDQKRFKSFFAYFFSKFFLQFSVYLPVEPYKTSSIRLKAI